MATVVESSHSNPLERTTQVNGNTESDHTSDESPSAPVSLPHPVNLVKVEPPHPILMTKLEPESPLQSPTDLQHHQLPPTPTSSVPGSPMSMPMSNQSLPSPNSMTSSSSQQYHHQDAMAAAVASSGANAFAHHPFYSPAHMQGFQYSHAMPTMEAHHGSRGGPVPPGPHRMPHYPPHHQFGGKDSSCVV